MPKPAAPSLRVTRRQVLSYRMQKLGLTARTRTLGDAVGELGLPDFPPGAALDALACRLAKPGPDTLDSAFEAHTLVRMRAMRGAPLVLRPADYDTFIAGVLPPDEAAMRAFLGPALTSVRAAKLSALDAVEQASAITTRALARGPLDRDQLHAQLRRALPKALLPFCRPCNSHHAHPALVYAVALYAQLVLFPRASGPYLLARRDRWLKTSKARPAKPTALLQRFLHHYGPVKLADYSTWAGISPAHARSHWTALASQLEPVQVEGSTQPSYALAQDIDALRAAEPEAAPRLLAPGDPLLQARDRDLLGDKAFQALVWKNLSLRAVITADAAAIGSARLQRDKTTLRVTIQAQYAAPTPLRKAIEEEAARLAQARGLRDASVAWTKGAAPRSRA
jgi:hypothetical protein